MLRGLAMTKQLITIRHKNELASLRDSSSRWLTMTLLIKRGVGLSFFTECQADPITLDALINDLHSVRQAFLDDFICLIFKDA